MKTSLLLLKFKLLYCLFSLLFSFSSLSTFAQTNLLGKYEFEGASTADNQFNQVTVQPSHATFSPFRREVVQWWKGNNVFNSRKWGKDSTEINYIEFKVTAQPGYSLNLSKISFLNSRTTEGPRIARISHNLSGNFDTDFKRYVIPEADEVTDWDFADIVLPLGGSVTFRIYGWGATSYLGAFRLDNVNLFGTVIPQVRINEFHYANTAATGTGFIELAVPKDYTSLGAVQIGLYNAAGNVYNTFPLNNFKSNSLNFNPDERLFYLDIPAGLAEPQGGISIYSGTHIIQFLSYGGEITAISGPAAGLKSKDTNIAESAANGPDNSLYLALPGNANYAPGTWGRGFDNSNTKGYPNIDNSILPVELVFFRAQAATKEVNLSWATATEINNEKFVVERSQQEISNFQEIATIKGNGTTQTELQYKFTDTRPLPGTSYYRLKQVDSDGLVTYSPVLAVKRLLADISMSIYPNPAVNTLHVNLGQINQVKEIQVQIVNAIGQVVYQEKQQSLNSNIITVPVTNLPAGKYYLVTKKDGKQESKAFIKF